MAKNEDYAEYIGSLSDMAEENVARHRATNPDAGSLASLGIATEYVVKEVEDVGIAG